MYIIYGLVNNNTIYYIGSTINIKKRIRDHENTCFNQNCNYKVYDFIRENNLEINYVILEENISKENRFIKEREWYEKYDNLMNIQIPTRSCREYREDNKEKAKEKIKEYRENNGEKIKECLKEYYENNKEKFKEYRKNNKERLNEKSKEYYENNKEKVKEYTKQYYENNIEKIKEYYKNNKEKFKEKHKEYYDKNREKIKEYRENNKEKIKEYKSKLWKCSQCNKIITLCNKNRHLKLHNK